MKKAFLVRFELTARAVIDVKNPSKLSEKEENAICWVGKEKIREFFNDYLIPDNIADIVEDTEMPYGSYPEEVDVTDLLKDRNIDTLYDFYNDYREEVCGVAEETLYDMHSYEDFYHIANMYGLDMAKRCQSRGRFWFAGSNYEKPTYVGSEREDLIFLVNNSVDKEYLERESLKKYMRKA